MEKIRKSSVSEQVVDHILGQIDDGMLRPGDRLPTEREFAEQLGISRVPLREAIGALAVMGVVEKRQGDGNFISTVSPDTLGRALRTYSVLNQALEEDLFEARELIEGTTAALAARNATEEDVSAMKKSLTAMEQAVPEYVAGRLPLEDMLTLDDAFHTAVAAASHNQFYIQFVRLLHAAGSDEGLFEEAYGHHRQKYFDSVVFHREMLSKIKARDEQGAQSTMCRHIKDIHDAIRGVREEKEEGTNYAI